MLDDTLQLYSANDTVFLKGATVFENGGNLQGGAGVDVLNMDGMDGPIVFSNLTSGDAKITGFEVIDLSGGNQNTLTLSCDDVRNMAVDSPITFNLNNGSSVSQVTANALRVNGDAEDRIVLAGNDLGAIGTTAYNGKSYTVYQDTTNNNNYVLVQSHLL
jgi:hypothetical protein